MACQSRRSFTGFGPGIVFVAIYVIGIWCGQSEGILTGNHAAIWSMRTLLLAAFTMMILALSPSLASAQDRTLSLYNTHTHERLTVTFKRNGRFVQSGLDQLNRFLRDWRRDEVTRIDPDLFDIVWSVYREVGASQPIHVVSAYRSPATNNLLRRRSSGVARNSQHTQGRAMDFFVPGVSASALRAAGLRMQGGGVGYYPRANTPFVHLDTGSIRMWPRMTRSQLSRVFPNGRTVHVPADGRPMSGFEQAQRELQRGSSSSRQVTIATNSSASSAQNDGDGDIVLPTERGGGFLAALFGGGNDEPSAPPASVPAASVPSAPATAPAATQVAAVTQNTGPRERYNPPSPVLPPNTGVAAQTVPGQSVDETVLARASVPAPVPAPTIDELQIAALAPSPAIAPATDPADLPAISREQQIEQSVPAPGQIAAIIEARFAEQRAREDSLRGQVDQVVVAAATSTPAPSAPGAIAQTAPTTALQATQIASAPPASAPAQTLQAQALALQAPQASQVPQPPASIANAALASAAPAAPSLAAPATAPLTVAAQPRFIPPNPTPVARPQSVQLALAPTAQSASAVQASPAVQAASQIASPAQAAPSANSVVAAAFATGMTAQLYPLADDLSAALAKHSIRGSQHAALLPPSGTITLSPTLVQSSGFEPSRSFEPRSDRFGAVFSQVQSGS